jgi:hypothetical protein
LSVQEGSIVMLGGVVVAFRGELLLELLGVGSSARGREKSEVES